MQDPFSHLTEDQRFMLADAFPYIAILVGEADGKLDEQELTWAKELTHIRSFSGNESLRGLYELAEKRFSERFTAIRPTLSNDIAHRTDEIMAHLKQLNPILAALEPEVGARLYMSLRSFAKHIANASGGILRFWSVSGEEAAVLDLPTLDAIHFEGLADEGEEKNK